MQVLNTKVLKLTRNQKGLTLIELLAVIIVLGIIMAIAVPSVMGVINRSKIQADKGSYLVIQEAGLRYAIATEAKNGDVVTVSALASAGYLNGVPEPRSNKVSEFGSVKISLTGNNYSVEVYTDTTASDANKIDPAVFD